MTKSPQKLSKIQKDLQEYQRYVGMPEHAVPEHLKSFVRLLNRLVEERWLDKINDIFKDITVVEKEIAEGIRAISKLILFEPDLVKKKEHYDELVKMTDYYAEQDTSVKKAVEQRKEIEVKIENEAETQFINKSNLLVQISHLLYQKKYESAPYKDEQGRTWQALEIKLDRGASVSFRFQGESENALADVIDALNYSINDAYPAFDKQVGYGYNNVKQLAAQAGLAKRWSYAQGVRMKPINSYDPKTIGTLNRKLTNAGGIMVEFRNYRLTVSTTQSTNNHYSRPFTKDYIIKSYKSSLVDSVELENGKTSILPNRLIMLDAYGQTIESAIALTNDDSITAIQRKNYFPSIPLQPEERKVTKDPYKNTENLINSRLSRLRRGKVDFTMPVEDFRAFYSTKSDKEFRRAFRNNIERYVRRNGGKVAFTDQINKKGVISEDTFLPYLYVSCVGNKIYDQRFS